MKSASWKGARGTALLCDEEDATFVRRLIGDLAAQGNASVALLRVDGRPIAAQVLLYCGTRPTPGRPRSIPNSANTRPGRC